MSANPPGPRAKFRRHAIDGALVGPNDPRHPEHARWIRERAQDYDFYSRLENDRRQRYPGEERRQERVLYLGPICWIPERFKDGQISAEHPAHSQHTEWLLWKQDLALDTPSDSMRRDQMQKLRQSRNEDLNFMLQLGSARRETLAKPLAEPPKTSASFWLYNLWCKIWTGRW